MPASVHYFFDRQLKYLEHLKSGFTIIEILIVMALVGIVSLGGFSALTSIRQKQVLANTIHQLQTAIDTAKIKSAAVAPNVNGSPSAWGVLIDVNNRSFTLGPFDPQYFSNQPTGFQTTPLPTGLNFRTYPPVNNPQQLLIYFERLSASPHLYKKPGNQLVEVNNWQPSLQISVQAATRQQSLFLTSSGLTTVQ